MTHIGVSREPQSLRPSCQKWQTKNHSTGGATDIFPRWDSMLVWRNQHHSLSVTEGFILYHSGITLASSTILSEPSGSIPCVASSAITWVNLPTVGGQPTQMYQLLQWACSKHSVHGRTELYRTNWTVAHGELFHRRQGLLLDYSGMKELLTDSSLSHLDYESRIYDNGLCGTSMSGICYIIAEQY